MDTRVDVKTGGDHEDHIRSPLHGRKVAQSAARRYSTALQLNQVAWDGGGEAGCCITVSGKNRNHRIACRILQIT
jgi:hypothetical protein